MEKDKGPIREFPEILESLIEEWTIDNGSTKKDLVPLFGSSIYKYCKTGKDKREPDLKTLTKIADFFKVSSDYLLGRTKDRRPEGYKYYLNELLPHFPDDIKAFVVNEGKASYITFAKEMSDVDIDTRILEPIIESIREAKKSSPDHT